MNDLKVSGEVGSARSFGSADLATLDEQIADVGTVVPGRTGTAVKLRAILRSVQIQPSARFATLTSSDGTFAASVPLSALEEAVVVYRQGNDPLPDKLGGPFRFLIPHVDNCAEGGVDACANVKFLGSIELSCVEGNDTRPTTKQAHKDLHRGPL